MGPCEVADFLTRGRTDKRQTDEKDKQSRTEETKEAEARMQTMTADSDFSVVSVVSSVPKCQPKRLLQRTPNLLSEVVRCGASQKKPTKDYSLRIISCQSGVVVVYRK